MAWRNKGASNSGGTSWSGDSGESSSSKRCDQGGNDHSGAVVTSSVQVTEKSADGTRWITKTVKRSQCQRCGRNDV